MRPREKFDELGKDALSNKELISIILGSGSRNASVLNLSKEVARLIEEDGKKVKLSDLALIKGIGLVKAQKILASLELGRRLYSTTNQSITGSRDVWLLSSEITNSSQEQVMILFLNGNKELIEKTRIAMGTLNCIHLDIGAILRKAFQIGAGGVILVHNHPSGDCTPSQSDITVTNRLEKACQLVGLEFFDHVIVAKEKFLSIGLD
jgi:DNA repair protein RadC